MKMPRLRYEFITSRRHLSVQAQVADGWKRGGKTYCFAESLIVEWKGDRPIRVSVSMFPSPMGHQERAATPPLFLPAQGVQDHLNYSLGGGVVEIVIPLGKDDEWLNPELNWQMQKTESPKPFVHWRIPPWNLQHGFLSVADVGADDLILHKNSHYLLEDLGAIRYRLKVWIVLQPPMRKPVPDVRDWGSRFFSGGLPSLGKRR
jgi:hypothetical protein